MQIPPRSTAAQQPTFGAIEDWVVPDSESMDDLVRELYARFGLAYYVSEVLHRGLCIRLALSDLPPREMLTKPRIEERLARAFSLTLGEVINQLTGKIPEAYLAKLEQARDTRNLLAHHFWFDRAHLMFHSEHIQKLISELDGYTQTFGSLDEENVRWLADRDEMLGLTREMRDHCLAELLSGRGNEPLPGKTLVKDREKRLNRKQRLVNVWEFTLPEGGKPLIFQLQDGTLWQLCDVGLGWTRFTEKQAHWIEHPAFKPYLPAEIIPRPRDTRPWEYEFTLKDGTIFWVKPGNNEAFRWGLRTRRRAPNNRLHSDGASPAREP
jgi:hypothetical protein